VESPSGSHFAELIEKLNYLQPSLDTLSLRMVKDVLNILHETTIAASVITCHIDLLHPDSPFSPPWESNMFLNFCRQWLFVKKIQKWTVLLVG